MNVSAIRCPLCGADPGAPCLQGSRGRCRPPHAARVQAAGGIPPSRHALHNPSPFGSTDRHAWLDFPVGLLLDGSHLTVKGNRVEFVRDGSAVVARLAHAPKLIVGSGPTPRDALTSLFQNLSDLAALFVHAVKMMP